LISKLEAVERGEIKRLMIFMPPRHGKSLLSSQIFPAWYLGRNPSKSVIMATYAQDLSDDFGRVVRNFANDPYTQTVFPELDIAEDSNSMKRFVTSAGGAYYAVGRGSAITGRGADLLVIDDPIKDADEARSENVRHALHEWYSSVAYTRLQPGGAVIIIQTRWHESDLAGWLLKEHPEENWDVLSLPAIAECDWGDRREGEALWPERFTAEMLASIKMAVGGAAWAALYQQRPTAAEGEVFKREWWQRYTEFPPKFKRIVQSWDTAFKTGQTNDYSVGTTWGEAENGFYLLDLWKGRAEFPALKRQVAALAKEWKPNAILVEDKASGQSLIQELKQSTPFPVMAIKVDTDKLSRAYAASPLVEAGKVFLPKDAPWLADYLYTLSVFPAGAHDDDVDSTTQALNYMRGSNHVYGLLDFYKQAQLLPGTPAQQAEAIASIKLLPAPSEPAETAPERCPACAGTFIQKTPSGKRCGGCGTQFGMPAFVPDKTQVRAL
jgi:predicted phage terminase large subunit-like protein